MTAAAVRLQDRSRLDRQIFFRRKEGGRSKSKHKQDAPGDALSNGPLAWEALRVRT